MSDSADLSGKIIGAAIRVHAELGPGFLESLYEQAVCIELRRDGFQLHRQVPVPVSYRGELIGEHRIDLLVEKRIVVELKAIQALEPIHFATVRSYLKATKLELGLLLNFARATLEVKRVGREWHRRTIGSFVESDVS